MLNLINVYEPSKQLQDEPQKCSQFFGLKIALKWQKVGGSRNQLYKGERDWLEHVIYEYK